MTTRFPPALKLLLVLAICVFARGGIADASGLDGGAAAGDASIDAPPPASSASDTIGTCRSLRLPVVNLFRSGALQ